MTEPVDPSVLTDEEIDNLVEEWHLSPAGGPELHEWLGMSLEDYSLWAQSPKEWRVEMVRRATADLRTARDRHERMLQERNEAAKAAWELGVPQKDIAAALGVDPAIVTRMKRQWLIDSPGPRLRGQR